MAVRWIKIDICETNCAPGPSVKITQVFFLSSYYLVIHNYIYLLFVNLLIVLKCCGYVSKRYSLPYLVKILVQVYFKYNVMDFYHSYGGIQSLKFYYCVIFTIVYI